MSAVAQMKLEPASPLGTAAADDELQWAPNTDTDLYWTTEELEEHLTCDTKGEVLSKMLDLIENLDDDNAVTELHDDSFSNYWMEGKSFPLFEEPLPLIKPEEKATVYDPTQHLLKEFETVFDAVNNGAFTPPQSPPYQAPVLTTLETPTLYTLSPQSDHTYQITVIPVDQQKTIDFLPPTPQPDVAHELAVVDELVRTRVEHLVPSSPSPSNSSVSDSSEDPEWTLESSSDEYKITPKSGRKRSKPYAHFPEDKKSRKKEQNKNAATRYRMKKKQEVEVILEEEKILQDKNKGLEDNITDLQREIKYLKGLMRDLFKAKGLIQ